MLDGMVLTVYPGSAEKGDNNVVWRCRRKVHVGWDLKDE